MEVNCPNCAGGIVTATGAQCSECVGTGVLNFERVNPIETPTKVTPIEVKRAKLAKVKPLKAKKKKHG